MNSAHQIFHASVIYETVDSLYSKLYRGGQPDILRGCTHVHDVLPGRLLPGFRLDIPVGNIGVLHSEAEFVFHLAHLLKEAQHFDGRLGVRQSARERQVHLYILHSS